MDYGGVCMWGVAELLISVDYPHLHFGQHI